MVLIKVRAELYRIADLVRHWGWIAVIPPGLDFCSCSGLLTWKWDSSVERTEEWLHRPSPDLDFTLVESFPLSGPQFFH